MDKKTVEQTLKYNDTKLENKLKDFHISSKDVIEGGFDKVLKQLEEKKTSVVDGKKKKNKKIK